MIQNQTFDLTTSEQETAALAIAESGDIDSAKNHCKDKRLRAVMMTVSNSAGRSIAQVANDRGHIALAKCLGTELEKFNKAKLKADEAEERAALKRATADRKQAEKDRVAAEKQAEKDRKAIAKLELDQAKMDAKLSGDTTKLQTLKKEHEQRKAAVAKERRIAARAAEDAKKKKASVEKGTAELKKNSLQTRRADKQRQETDLAASQQQSHDFVISHGYRGGDKSCKPVVKAIKKEASSKKKLKVCSGDEVTASAAVQDWRTQYFTAMMNAKLGTVCFVNRFYNGQACIDEWEKAKEYGTKKRAVVLMEPMDTMPIGGGEEQLPVAVHSNLNMQFIKGYEMEVPEMLAAILEAFTN